jgi:hypothetical protein
MPRGGTGKPDAFSPYKTASGRDLELLKSGRSKTGYLNIVEQHPGKFYPKLKLDDVKGSKVMKVFGAGHPTAREAAIFLAEYRAAPWELTSAPPRAPPGSAMTELEKLDKRMKRLKKMEKEFNELMGVPELNEEPLPPPVVYDGPVLILGESDA